MNQVDAIGMQMMLAHRMWAAWCQTVYGKRVGALMYFATIQFMSRRLP